MELKTTSEGYVLHVSRQELKHYLDVTTEAMIRGKLQVVFPVKDDKITEIVIYDE